MRRWVGSVLAAVALLTQGCVGRPAVDPANSSQTSPAPVATALTGHETGSGTLLVTPQIGSADLAAWTARVVWAADALAVTDLGNLDESWDGRLDVELTSSATQFLELAGSDSADAAAATRCLDGRGRITVNPRVLPMDADYLDALLLHEAVHVALASPCSPAAPQWIAEGLAEWVATVHSPSAAETNLAWLTQFLQANGVPDALPEDADFDGDDSLGVYALARYAVAAAVEHGGTAWAMDFFGRALAGTASAPELEQVAAWYRADLRRIADAG